VCSSLEPEQTPTDLSFASTINSVVAVSVVKYFDLAYFEVYSGKFYIK